MSNQATYDDANLILRLYELRREEKLRQAREWFAGNFNASTAADMQKIAPPGSKENAYMRMLVSYWEMVSSFVTAGVLNQDLLFQSGGELLVVWERIRHFVPELRTMFKNPRAFSNLETVGNAYIKYMESISPETYPGFQAMVATMVAGKQS